MYLTFDHAELTTTASTLTLKECQECLEIWGLFQHQILTITRLYTFTLHIHYIQTNKLNFTIRLYLKNVSLKHVMFHGHRVCVVLMVAILNIKLRSIWLPT